MSLLALLLVVPLANPPTVVSQTHVDSLWEFVQTLTASRNLPPEIYFTREDEPPTSPSFLAYYYEHTRVVRVSPVAVQMNRGLGYVYLILGHEMLHYALANHEPLEKHHCVFVERGYRERMVEFLITAEIAHPLLRVMQEAATGCDPSPGRRAAPGEQLRLTGGP
jgi:hypothetical protein